MVDLTSYKTRILSVEDEPLFDDAVKAAESGALRAAYVMIWLSCAESLKRKFREAQQRDGNATRIVGEFERKETEHKSIDKFLLDKAKEYGFLSDSAYSVLMHVYEMRCIYGHPYEQAPRDEQVLHAAAAVIEYVLSQPVKLRHGFGTQLLDNLLRDANYLDNQRVTVEQFAKEIIMRIDTSIHTWFLKKYWQELEGIADDPTLKVFFRRGVWFTQTYLSEVGINVFTDDQWHEVVTAFPKTLTRVFANYNLFSRVGQHAQDYLVGKLIEISDMRTDAFRILENLQENGVLSSRQKDRFFAKINTSDFSRIISAGLKINLCFARIIDALKSHNWYAQNPAIDFVRSNGFDQVSHLNLDEQCLLGRNILQATEGGSSSAISFLELISENIDTCPVNMIKGIVLEVFTNEEKQIRFKTERIVTVLKILDNIGEEQRSTILTEVALNIREGQLKYDWIDREEFASTSDFFRKYEWGVLLIQCLEQKSSMLPELSTEK